MQSDAIKNSSSSYHAGIKKRILHFFQFLPFLLFSFVNKNPRKKTGKNGKSGFPSPHGSYCVDVSGDSDVGKGWGGF